MCLLIPSSGHLDLTVLGLFTGIDGISDHVQAGPQDSLGVKKQQGNLLQWNNF